MWPAITYESCAWERDSDELALIPKSRRRKILSTYEAAVPACIAGLAVDLPAQLSRRIAEVEVSLARFDQAQAARNLVEAAYGRGILAKMGNARRGAFYQAPDLIAVLEEASSLQGIRRIAAR